MEKLIPVIIDGVPTYNLAITKDHQISWLKSVFENYKNYSIEFIINLHKKIQNFNSSKTFETILEEMDSPSFLLVSKNLLKPSDHMKEYGEYNKTDLYKLPKDVLVHLISTIQEESGIYYVIRIYYKHGEYNITEFSSKPELIDFLIDNLADGDITEDINEYLNEYNKYKNHSLKELVAAAKLKGEDNIINQNGYGIVAVIKGKLL